MLPPGEQGTLNSERLRRSPASVSPSVHGTMIPPSQGHREAQQAEASEVPSTQWALDQSSDLPGRTPHPGPGAGCPPVDCAGSVIFNCDSGRLGSGSEGCGETTGRATPRLSTPGDRGEETSGEPPCVHALPRSLFCEMMSRCPALFVNRALFINFPKQGARERGCRPASPLLHRPRDLSTAPPMSPRLHTAKLGAWPPARRCPFVSTPPSACS